MTTPLPPAPPPHVVGQQAPQPPTLTSDHHHEVAPANAAALCPEALKVGYVLGVTRVTYLFQNGALTCEASKAPVFEAGK